MLPRTLYISPKILGKDGTGGWGAFSVHTPGQTQLPYPTAIDCCRRNSLTPSRRKKTSSFRKLLLYPSELRGHAETDEFSHQFTTEAAFGLGALSWLGSDA